MEILYLKIFIKKILLKKYYNKIVFKKLIDNFKNYYQFSFKTVVQFKKLYYSSTGREPELAGLAELSGTNTDLID